MNCNYPNCHQPGIYQPIVSLPTIRTKGLIAPVFNPRWLDTRLMAAMGLDPGMAVAMYEKEVEEYKATHNDLIETALPTILTGRPVCESHKLTYNFMDWFGYEDWAQLIEAAQCFGVVLSSKDLTIRWESVNWEPSPKWVELER